MLPARVQYQSSIDLAAEGADAVVIVTDWPEFAQIDFRRLKAKMRTPVVIDLRNFLNEEEVQSSGLRYFGIGGRRRQAFEKADRRLVRSSRPFWFDSSPTMMEEDMLPGSVAAAD